MSPDKIMEMSLVSYDSGHNKIRWYEEDESESFEKGQFVYLDGDGQLTECAGNANEKILGMAMKDASGEAGTMIPVALAPGAVFSMSPYHDTEASAVNSMDNVGSATQFKVTSNKCAVDVANIGDAAEATLVIVGLDSRDTEGDQFARYLVKVAEDHYQLYA